MRLITTLALFFLAATASAQDAYTVVKNPPPIIGLAGSVAAYTADVQLTLTLPAQATGFRTRAQYLTRNKIGTVVSAVTQTISGTADPFTISRALTLTQALDGGTVSAVLYCDARIGASWVFVAMTAVPSAPITIVPPAAPTIESQPQAVALGLYEAKDFSVSAKGYPSVLAYQWYVDAGTGWVAIDGATSPTLTISYPKATDHGKLFRVGVTNAIGTTFSDSATLTVYGAPNPLTNWIQTIPARIGDVVTASADVPTSAGPGPLGSVTYEWTDINGNVISTSSTVTFTVSESMTWAYYWVLTPSGATSGFVTIVLPPAGNG